MRLNWYGWWKVIVELYLGPDADPSKLGAWREASYEIRLITYYIELSTVSIGSEPVRCVASQPERT